MYLTQDFNFQFRRNHEVIDFTPHELQSVSDHAMGKKIRFVTRSKITPEQFEEDK